MGTYVKIVMRVHTLVILKIKRSRWNVVYVQRERFVMVNKVKFTWLLAIGLTQIHLRLGKIL